MTKVFGSNDMSHVNRSFSSKCKQNKRKSENFWTKYFYENGDVRYRAQVFKVKNNMFVKLSKQIFDENYLKYQKNKNITLCIDAWRELKNYVEMIDTIFCTNIGNLTQLDNTGPAPKLIYDDGLGSIPKIERTSPFGSFGTKLNIDQNELARKEFMIAETPKVELVPIFKRISMDKVTHKCGRPSGSKNKTKACDHDIQSTDTSDLTCDNQQDRVSSKQSKRKYQRRMIDKLEYNKQMQANRSKASKIRLSMSV